jgi:hypothetical protein
MLVIRGGDDNAEKLRRQAERTHRAYLLGGRPFYGLSVYRALDQLAERRLSRQLASYRRLLACFDPASHNPGYGRLHRR